MTSAYSIAAVILTLAVSGLSLASAQCPNPVNGIRADVSQKGSLLIFPHVRVALALDSDQILEDTFLQISNDFNSADVDVRMFFVCGSNCSSLSTELTLTKNQPLYWSAATGKAGPRPISVPITATPGCARVIDGRRVFEGYVMLLAVKLNDRPGRPFNFADQPIRWNHLTGLATQMDYELHTAWEYSPYAFQAVIGDHGDPVGEPGTLKLDGIAYQSGFNRLLLEFISGGSIAFSGGGKLVQHDTQLTLMINDIDIQKNITSFQTRVQLAIWNQDEVSFAAAYCIPCWDTSRLSQVDRTFSLPVLGFDAARAVIEGVASADACEPRPGVVTAEHALLGVAAKRLSFSSGQVAVAGSALAGTGQQCATIQYSSPLP